MSAALADDPALVKTPYVEVGDCWSYRASRFFYQGWIRDFRECVTYVDKEKNVVFALVTVKDDGREIETSYSLEWADSATLEGRYNKPPAKFLKFPLHVGDKYELNFSITSSRGFGHQNTPARYEMEVIRWEDVSVPAGRFRALRIEGRGTMQGGTQTWTEARVIWYAPEVNRAVKWSFSENLRPGPMPADNFEVELTQYDLNK